jgi:hypothetical protein
MKDILTCHFCHICVIQLGLRLNFIPEKRSHVCFQDNVFVNSSNSTNHSLFSPACVQIPYLNDKGKLWE